MGQDTKKILILGGGFAGIECARRLESYFKRKLEIEIILVSEDNFFLFSPMLPQVASGMIETRHIITPIRIICKKTKFYESRIKNIDPFGKIVNLVGTSERRGISLEYDYLVIALGSQANFFGLDKMENLAYSMKTLSDAVVLRNRVIDMLEQAENEDDPILKKSLLTFVIVGAGFGGVETAGELIDLVLDARKHYPCIDREDIRVIIVEAASFILPGFNEKLAEFALKKLRQRGIEVKLNTKLSSFSGTEAIIEDAIGPTKSPVNQPNIGAIQTRTLIWTAGVSPVDIIKNSVFKTSKGGIVVNEFLEIPDFLGVFAIGDCSTLINPKTQRPYPGTAQNAQAEAKTAAYNVRALIRKEQKIKFEYSSKGQMAIIGKRAGIAKILGLHLHGIVAWWIWRTIYLSKIPKFDKRFRILLDWTIDLFFDRDIARLKILRHEASKEYKELDEVDDVW